MRELSKAPVQTYGFDVTADIQGSAYSDMMKFDDNFQPGETAAVSMYNLKVTGQETNVELINVIGQAAASATLAAAVVGQHLGLDLNQIKVGLRKYVPMPGRMRLIPGIKGSLLIDDSYNAAPASVIAGLEALHEFSPIEGARRIAVLGDMLELGEMSNDEHRRVGRVLVAKQVDLLVTAGELALGFAEGAKEAGLNEDQIQSFGTSKEAGRWLDSDIRTGDIVLIKGSQGARMEKVTKELMAEPLKAKALLVRQFSPWIEE